MNTDIWLWILLVMLPHNSRTMDIIGQFDNVRSAAVAMRDGSCEQLTDNEKRRTQQVRNKDINALKKLCFENDIRIITIEDDEYPPLLRSIHNPPIVLFVQGTLANFNASRSIAVVGTREPSDYGIMAATRICNGLVATGTAIVSGLAVGLDTVVHRCALDGNVPTVGVLACGNLVDYPKESAQLKKDIISAGGAIISELLPHTTAKSGYFHQRNRIISGLCMGTLITEAPVRSGCLITADFAIEQERLLFCIPPHDISLVKYAGVIRYLRNGAIPCFSHLDIINAAPDTASRIDIEKLRNSIDDIEQFIMREEVLRQAGISRKRKGTPSDQHSHDTAQQSTQEHKSDTADTADTADTSASEQVSTIIDEQLLQSLDENSAALLKLIAEQPKTTDELIELTGIGYFDITALLTDMEISGYITLNAGGFYSLI